MTRYTVIINKYELPRTARGMCVSRSESAVAVLLMISTTLSDYYIVLKVLLLGPGLSVL